MTSQSSFSSSSRAVAGNCRIILVFPLSCVNFQVLDTLPEEVVTLTVLLVLKRKTKACKVVCAIPAFIDIAGYLPRSWWCTDRDIISGVTMGSLPNWRRSVPPLPPLTCFKCMLSWFWNFDFPVFVEFWKGIAESKRDDHFGLPAVRDFFQLPMISLAPFLAVRVPSASKTNW